MTLPKRSKRTRRKFSGDFKAKVALEAITAQETVNQIATRYEVHPHQVTQWKQQLLQQAPAAFEQPATLSQLMAWKRNSTRRSGGSRCSWSGLKKVGALDGGMTVIIQQEWWHSLAIS